LPKPRVWSWTGSRREFAGNLSFAQLEKLAAAVPIGSSGPDHCPGLRRSGFARAGPDGARRMSGLTLQHGRAEF